MTETYEGACHCGALGVSYSTALRPGDAVIRECQCGFCRLHAAQVVSDPTGSLRFDERVPGTLHRYTFGLKTADYLLCTRCGAYMGAVITTEGARFGIVNIRTLADYYSFTGIIDLLSFDAEDLAQRVARRVANWTPVLGGT